MKKKFKEKHQNPHLSVPPSNEEVISVTNTDPECLPTPQRASHTRLPQRREQNVTHQLTLASTSCLVPALFFGTLDAVFALHVPSFQHILNCFFAGFLVYGSAGLVAFVGFAVIFLVFRAKLHFRQACFLSLLGATFAPMIFFAFRDGLLIMSITGHPGFSFIDVLAGYVPYSIAGLLSGSTSMALLAWRTTVSPGPDSLIIAGANQLSSE